MDKNISSDVFNGKQPSNEIWYTTLDESLVYYTNYVRGPQLISSTYENGKGIMVFDQDLVNEVITIRDSEALSAISFPDSYTFKCYKENDCSIFFECKNLERIKYSKGDGRFLIVDDYLVNVANSSLESIDLPEGLNVRRDAFIGERGKLQIVHVGKGSSLQEGALAGLSNLKKICGEFSTANKIAWIENNTLIAFATGAHTHYSIPDGVCRIGRDAFASSNLKTLKIPRSVSSIGWNAFGNLNSVIISGKNVDKNHENYVLNGELLIHFSNPQLKYLHPAVIPEGVKGIHNCCNKALFKEHAIVFPSSLEFVSLDLSETEFNSMEFRGLVPPVLHLRGLEGLDRKRIEYNNHRIELYSEWKRNNWHYPNLLVAVTTALSCLEFENGYVPSIEDSYILLKVIVPHGSIEEYRRAFRQELGQFEKVIDIVEKEEQL